MNTITENDDDEGELIPVETPPTQDAADQGDEHDQDEDDSEDERLAQSEDDSDEEITASANRERRRKRREIQKKAKEHAQREIAELRQMVATLTQRVTQTETQTATATAQTVGANLGQRLARAQADLQQAERIMAAAAEAGNGSDMVAAMRIRDEARDEMQQLVAAQQQVQTMQQQAAQPRVDPAVVNYAKEWMDANPWYNPNGTDRDSALTKAIDAELAREGFNPATRRYWEELTDRVAEAFDGPGERAPARGEGSERTTRRGGPPTGNSRQHAPASTRKEIYVTPERRAAMEDAGVWDDPVARQRYLKAYQEYDRANTAR